MQTAVMVRLLVGSSRTRRTQHGAPVAAQPGRGRSLQPVGVEPPREPGVLQRPRGRGPLRGVKPQELRQEAQEALVLRAHALPQRGALGQVEHGPALLQRGEGAGLLRRRQAVEPPVGREVPGRLPALGEHARGEGPEDARDARKEALHGVVLEEHAARPELRDDTAQGPEVDLLVVGQAKDHLRRAVGARLHVAREVVTQEAGGAKVNELDLAPRVGPHEDVLRLEVRVNEREAVDVVQRHEHLPADPLQAAQGEVGRVGVLAHGPGEVVEVLAEELRDDDQVLLEVKVVHQVQAALCINVVSVCLDDPEQLDLVDALVQDVLVVLDYLHAHQLVCLQVQALHRM
mmetsp:Transcript_475/g.1325  ORF Transcript_475/g.1325 Transcript_475/m.1325 type:complete len:346 (+) Transcript_475:66-1103(+)